MQNIDIRLSLFKHNVKQFEVARVLGKSDSAFSMFLREELSEEDKAMILSIIERIADSRKDGSINDNKHGAE